MIGVIEIQNTSHNNDDAYVQSNRTGEGATVTPASFVGLRRTSASSIRVRTTREVSHSPKQHHPKAYKMHSALVRLQNVFGFFTTVAFTVAAVIALSSFVSPQTPTADIQLRNVQVVKGRPHYYSYKKEEYAHIKFDLDTGTSESPSQ